MSPRALATWSAAAMAMVVLTNNPVYRALIALLALNLVVARRRPGVSVRALLVFLSITSVWTVAYNPLLDHAGVHRLATIPSEIPGIGGAVTLESLVYGLSAAVGVVAAALAVAPLVMILDPTDLLQSLPTALHGTGTALAAALNMVPSVARSFVSVREAESLRGGTSRRGPAAIIATLVPVALTTIESSITLAEAMEARAYGSGPRTRYREPRSVPADRVVMGSAALAVAGMAALRLAGTELDWYPFPTVSLPSVSAAAVGLCMLLVAPLLVGRRPPAPERLTAAT